jgi:hypothetical protein
MHQNEIDLRQDGTERQKDALTLYGVTAFLLGVNYQDAIREQLLRQGVIQSRSDLPLSDWQSKFSA